MFFKKRKKTEEEEHVEWLINSHQEDINKTLDNALRWHENGDPMLSFRNQARRLRSLSDLALIQWRQKIDPRNTVEELVQYFPKVLEYLEEHDKADQFGLRSSLFGFDTDLMDTMAWLAGKGSNIKDHASPNRPFFYGCSNYLLRVAMDIDVPDPDRSEFIAQINSKNTLPYQILQNNAKIIGVIPNHEDVDDLVKNAEKNWELRSSSKFFEKHVGTTSGFAQTNYLYLDFYLAAALRKIDWRGNSIHQWIW